MFLYDGFVVLMIDGNVIGGRTPCNTPLVSISVIHLFPPPHTSLLRQTYASSPDPAACGFSLSPLPTPYNPVPNTLSFHYTLGLRQNPLPLAPTLVCLSDHKDITIGATVINKAVTMNGGMVAENISRIEHWDQCAVNKMREREN